MVSNFIHNPHVTNKKLSHQYSLTELIQNNRPPSIREYDQIPMRSTYLLAHAKYISTKFKKKRVVFIGDHDCVSLLIGLLSYNGYSLMPTKMLVLDFDERLLLFIKNIAHKYGFSNHLDVMLYNAFDPIPRALNFNFNYFHTNPPYGSRNNGESARLFISRGLELVKAHPAAQGCIILPDNGKREWTQKSMQETQKFLINLNWKIEEKINNAHKYHLDDDPELPSSRLIISRSTQDEILLPNIAGRRVRNDEIPHFYGRTVFPPYPRYIKWNGMHDFKW